MIAIRNHTNVIPAEAGIHDTFQRRYSFGWVEQVEAGVDGGLRRHDGTGRKRGMKIHLSPELEDLAQQVATQPDSGVALFENLACSRLGLKTHTNVDGEPSLSREDGREIRITPLGQGVFWVRQTDRRKPVFIPGDGVKVSAREAVARLLDFSNGVD